MLSVLISVVGIATAAAVDEYLRRSRRTQPPTAAAAPAAPDPTPEEEAAAAEAKAEVEARTAKAEKAERREEARRQAEAAVAEKVFKDIDGHVKLATDRFHDGSTKPRPLCSEMKAALELKGVRANYQGEDAYVEACKNARIDISLSTKGRQDFEVRNSPPAGDMCCLLPPTPHCSSAQASKEAERKAREERKRKADDSRTAFKEEEKKVKALKRELEKAEESLEKKRKALEDAEAKLAQDTPAKKRKGAPAAAAAASVDSDSAHVGSSSTMPPPASMAGDLASIHREPVD